MMERKVSVWLTDMGDRFKQGRYCRGEPEMGVKEFVENADARGYDLCTAEGLQTAIDSFVSIDCLEIKEDDPDEHVDWRLYNDDGMRQLHESPSGLKSALKQPSPLAHL
eukprot:2216930-Karenia_brevis.AAC.1